MSNGEVMFLILVAVVFAAFMGVLAYATSSEEKSRANRSGN